MENKIVFAGGCLACLGMFAALEVYEGRLNQEDEALRATMSRRPPAPAETGPQTADGVIAALAERLAEGPAEARAEAASEALEVLGSEEIKPGSLSPEAGEVFVSSLEGITDEGIKAKAAGFVAGRISGEAGRNYVLRVLSEGTPEEKSAALAGVGRPGGVRGKTAFARVAELAGQGGLGGEHLPGALARLGGRKAAEPILAIMKSTDNARIIASCAVALQDIGAPDAVKSILERLDETGRLEDRSALPWFDRKALAVYLQTADEKGLALGLRVLRARPSLVAGNLDPVSKGLVSGDPAVRGVTAEALRVAVARRFVPAQKGRDLLRTRLDQETEPLLRAQLTGAIQLAQEMADEELEATPQ